MKLLLLIIYLLCSSSGLLFMKMGTENTVIKISKSVFTCNLSLQLILGFVLYIISFILWTVIISKYNLSYIYPLATSILFILVLILSSVFLKETIMLSQIIGILIIIIGIVVSNLKF